MQTFTQKYAIVQFLEPVKEGLEYPASEWPLHTTLIDVFATAWTAQELRQCIEDVAANTQSFSVRALEDIELGAEKVCVTKLERTAELANLHEVLLQVLEGGNLALNNPEFSREGFLPHVTMQKSSRVAKGNSVTFRQLSVIDMFPSEDPYRRKVISHAKTKE